MREGGGGHDVRPRLPTYSWGKDLRGRSSASSFRDADASKRSINPYGAAMRGNPGARYGPASSRPHSPG